MLSCVVNENQNFRVSLIGIVDDDAAMREAVASLLRSVGFKVESFSSGEEFLKSPLLNETDCLILDVRMPGVGGMELQLRLRSMGIRIPIIFVTAHGTRELEVRAMNAGAVAFLIKPFSGESLLQAISRSLKRSIHA